MNNTLEKIRQVRIRPSWEEIDSLKVPLTDGERSLAKYLDKYLPDDWEIFIKTEFKGYNKNKGKKTDNFPDIIIAHEKYGAVIFEVKDWVLDSRETINNKFYVKLKGGDKCETQSPLEQPNRYFDKVIEESDDLSQLILENKFQILKKYIRPAIYFHKAKTAEARDFADKKNKYEVIIFGNDYYDFKSIDGLFKIVPQINEKNKNDYFLSHLKKNSKWFKKLKNFIYPSDWHYARHIKVNLHPEENKKKKILTSKSNAHWRLRGAARSGKTFVIVEKAARSANEKKSVLIVTFNRTQKHYIKSHLKRASVDYDKALIQVDHFHKFCKNYLILHEQYIPKPNDKKWLQDELPYMVSSLRKKENDLEFDVILIDEGQDFNEAWFNTLQAFTSDHNEMMIVQDEKQNIYERDTKWIRKTKKNPHMQDWISLKKTDRIPNNIAIFANNFAKRYIDNENQDVQDSEIFSPIEVDYHRTFFDGDVNIQEVDENSFEKDVYLKFLKIYKHEANKLGDITIVVFKNDHGVRLVNYFQKKNKEIIIKHIFDLNKESYTISALKKELYSYESDALGITTVQSFKGWDSKNILMIIPAKKISSKSLYVAITRATGNLFLFNSNKFYSF